MRDKTTESLHGDYRPENNRYRRHKLAVHEKLESTTGKKIFYIDAITGPGHEIVDVFAGHVPELEEVEYPAADRYFCVKVPQFDILVTGLPHILDYDRSDNPGCACNFASRPARGWRNKPILKENGVIIALGSCSGAVSLRRPADLEAYLLNKWGHDLYDCTFWIPAFAGMTATYLLSSFRRRPESRAITLIY